MPSKNRLKTYVKGAHYHIYNRGVAKQKIFEDEQDYKVYLKYLKEALTEPKETKINFILRGRSFQAIPRVPKNFKKEIILLAFCLMPNHFHLLVKQNETNSMEHFMRSIITRYAAYYNKKYDRVGPLFQGRYKAVMIDKEEYLLHLSRYIHLNPRESNEHLETAFSSYADYIKLRNTTWLNTEIILKFFEHKTIPEIRKINSYKTFVETLVRDSGNLHQELTLD